MRNDKQIKEQAKEYVKEYGEVKEVTTMRLSDSILEKDRQEEKKDTIINLYHLGIDISTIAKGVRLTEQEVLDIISKHK